MNGMDGPPEKITIPRTKVAYTNPWAAGLQERITS